MSAVDLARVTLRALLDVGVRDVVLSPGSRNTPLSLELAAADRAGSLRLHVRIDERTAAFLALGLAKGGGMPTAVVTTSGTAVANLHPAVIEASMSHTAIAVISANRPLEVLGTGANQTIDQLGIFGSAARTSVHLDDQTPQDWPDLLGDALAAMVGSPDGPGPVQIDLGLTPPLVPDPVQRAVESSSLRATEKSHASEQSPVPAQRMAAEQGQAVEQNRAVVENRVVRREPLALQLPPRTLVVVAECGEQLASSAVRAATEAGFPVHIEAGSALIAATDACLRAGAFLLRSDLVRSRRPRHLLVVGRPTLGRPVPTLATAPDIEVTVVSDQPGLSNALQTGRAALQADQICIDGAVDPSFADAWHRADAAASAVIDDATRTTYDAGSVTATVAESWPDLLVLASSNPIRDLDERAVRRRQRVVVNRGAAGIDGLVSTAIGAALADQRSTGSAADRPSTATALLGDLAFMHDSTALMIGPNEPRPDLTIVVINNDGGAIFAGLEQGAPAYDEHFERVFGTPIGVDIEALCAATRTPYARCADRLSLTSELARTARGIRVIEVPVSRANERERRHALTNAVVDAANAAI